jgi:hypothetical protein
MRRALAIAAGLVLAIPCAAAADAPSWSRATTAAVEPVDAYDPYFELSPGRYHGGTAPLLLSHLSESRRVALVAVLRMESEMN